MKTVMDGFQLIDRDMRVNLRALQSGMTEHCLDAANVTTRLQKLRCHCEPEQVTTATAGDACTAEDVTHLQTNAVWVNPFPSGVHG